MHALIIWDCALHVRSVDVEDLTTAETPDDMAQEMKEPAPLVPPIGVPNVYMLGFNPNPQMVTYERLEFNRFDQLGMKNRYSRHFTHPQQGWSDGPDGVYKRVFPAKALLPGCRTYAPVDIGRNSFGCQGGLAKVNSLAPFATLFKPVCGAFFDENTDHRKHKFGIPATDLVRSRMSAMSAR